MTYGNQRQEYKRGKRQSEANTKERSNSLVNKWIERGVHIYGKAKTRRHEQKQRKYTRRRQNGGAIAL